MKRLLKIIVISLFTIFSFYYTERIIDLSKNKDPIMEKIKERKATKEIEPINGIIDNNTIIVGVSGQKIDAETSYEKMKKIKEYNDSLLEYINIKPTIKKENNYDKLVIGSTTNERKISLVFTTNDISLIKQIVYILNKNNSQATIYIDGKVIEDNILELKELLNNNISLGIYSYNNIFDTVSTKYMKNLLSKNFNYSNYCLYKDDKFLNVCKYFKINTIKPELIERDIYNYLKSNKKSGSIYEIKANNNNTKQLNSVLIHLNQKGYEIIKIDNLLKE